jgi:hypothetical protein
LTRLGTVSHRSSPRGSIFRITGARERARGTGEFCLSGESCDPFSEEPVNQPDPTFPQSPGIILKTDNFNFTCRCPFCSFNELRTD